MYALVFINIDINSEGEKFIPSCLQQGPIGVAQKHYTNMEKVGFCFLQRITELEMEVHESQITGQSQASLLMGALCALISMPLPREEAKHH